MLAAIALLHPAIALRPPRTAHSGLRAGTRWSVALATGLLTATVLGGWWLYPGYRAADKPRLLRDAFEVALLFETKEHLAFYALVLAWGGCALVLANERGPVSPASRRIARLLFGASAALAVTVGVLGSIVGSASPG